MNFIHVGREDLGMIKDGARVFEVRDVTRLLGTVVEAGRGYWRPILPTGARAEFILPSRKQAGEWLYDASRDAVCSECNGSGELTRLGGDWGAIPDTQVPCWKCKGASR